MFVLRNNIVDNNGIKKLRITYLQSLKIENNSVIYTT